MDSNEITFDNFEWAKFIDVMENYECVQNFDNPDFLPISCCDYPDITVNKFIYDDETNSKC